MKNIHTLPTDKPSRLIIYPTLLNEFRLFNEPFEDWKHKRHIYITSYEEIKEGDWYYLPKENKVAKCHKGLKLSSVTPEWTQKIILTTDQDLIKDGVQAIDDEFLEWFIKNPSCEEVEIKGINFVDSKIGLVSDNGGIVYGFKYKIIIPKEIGFKLENGKRTETFYQKPKQSIIKTEEDAKIFIEALENIPEPNEKLKKAFKDFHKQETLEETFKNK